MLKHFYASDTTSDSSSSFSFTDSDDSSYHSSTSSTSSSDTSDTTSTHSFTSSSLSDLDTSDTSSIFRDDDDFSDTDSKLSEDETESIHIDKRSPAPGEEDVTITDTVTNKRTGVKITNTVVLRYRDRILSTVASAEGADNLDQQQDSANAPNETNDFRWRLIKGFASSESYFKAELKQLSAHLPEHYKKLGISPLRSHLLLQNSIGRSSKTKKPSTLQSLAMKLNEEGPIVIGGDQSRVWMESFYINGRTKRIKDCAGSVDKDLGIMVGGQYASLKNGWIFGIYSGTALGKVHGTDDRRNKTKQNQKFTSLYHSATFKSGFRYDIILQGIYCGENVNRLTSSQQIVSGKRHSTTYNYNLETSHVLKVKEGISFRPNLGLHLSNQRIKAYSETGSNQNFAHSSTTSSTREVYGGIGLRKQWKEVEDKNIFVAKLTGLYELGYELAYKGPSSTTTVINTGQTSEGSSYSTGKLSHKFTLTGSVQHNQLKIIGSCSTTLKKYRHKTMFTLKAEWRF